LIGGRTANGQAAMTVSVTRRDLGAEELRREAVRSRDAAATRRMLALALVLEGHPREAAARAAGVDRQTLRDWVRRYNAEGLAGLPTGLARDASRASRPGRRRRWKRSWSGGRTRRGTAWCVGGESTPGP
jgi:transposase-like protein